jgi:hypothetical protein
MSIDAGTIYSSVRVKLSDLESDINGAVGKFDKLAKKINETGKATENITRLAGKMSLTISAPIVAAGAAMVKFASDANESANAASVVFKESKDVILDWGKTAATQAGLSAAEFYQSSAVIGAGLQNAGYSAREAADETINLTKRAADMASIFNTDVKDSMLAIQSALRGESEPIRRYAVSLTEAAVQAKALELGLVKTGEELDTNAKTQARLALIMEQTSRFAGDFVNTSDELANSTRITTAMVKNEAAEFGKQLLPIMLDVIKAGRSLIGSLGSMSDEQRRTILTVAALAAGFGPLVLGVAKAIEAVKLLQGAMIALSANPIGLALAGIAALYIGLKKLGEENNKKMLAEVGEKFGEIGELAGVSAQKISDVQEAIARASRGGGSFTEMQAMTQQIAQDLGISVQQVALIGIKSEKTTEEMKRTLRSIKDVADVEQTRLSYMPGTVEFQKRVASLTKETADATEDIAVKTKQSKEELEKYKNARSDILSILEGEKSEYQKLQDQIDELNQVQWKQGSKLEEDRLKAIQILRDEQVKVTQEELAQKQLLIDKVRELGNETVSGSGKARQEMLQEIQDSELLLEQKQELIDKTNEYYDNLEKEESIRKFLDNTSTMLGGASDLISALSDYYDAMYERQAELLDLQMQEELEAAGLSEDTAVEKAQKEYDAAVASGDATNIEKARQELEKSKIEEKYAKKKAELEYKGEMQAWNLKKLSAVASTAQAVVNALNTQPFWVGLILAGVAASIGAIQLGTINQSKPIKSFATGGIVEPSGGGSLARVAENGSGEVLFNTGETGKAFVNQMASAIASQLGGSGSQTIHVILEVDGERMAENTMSYVRKGIVRGEG